MKPLLQSDLAKKVVRRCFRFRNELMDRVRPAYPQHYPVGYRGAVLSLLKPVGPATLAPFEERIKRAAESCIRHEFDLLGSGLVNVKHRMQCKGVEGHLHPYRPESGFQRLRRRMGNNSRYSGKVDRLIAGPYERLDWQLDFKSGFRWPQDAWYQSIRVSPGKGADIKVPWELGRMQHLTHLAWAFILAKAGTGGMRAAMEYADEYRNQILDFIGSNPPRLGVQWNCAMEVAIRVSNWLVSRDLLLGAGAEFDSGFENAFINSVREHGVHIRANLERYGQERNNHYLADLAGLAFVSAYLPDDDAVLEWRAFTSVELPSEIAYQFNPDGSNFEGSSAYHCFSAEMAAWGLAALAGRARSGPVPRLWRIPEKCLEQLQGMAAFIMGISKADGKIPQIGDNDNGRFFHLTPGDPDESGLDKRHVVAAIDGIVTRPDFRRFAGKERLERELMLGLAGEAAEGLPKPRIGSGRPGDRIAFEEFFRNREEGVSHSFGFASEPPFKFKIDSVEAFPDFGVFIFKGRGLYLSVRCGPAARKGSCGHFHNDQLSMELSLQGKDIITDPGTYLYTPSAHRRDEYRSTSAHFVPFGFSGIEQESLGKGMFRLGHESETSCLYAGEDGFLGKFHASRFEVRRGIRVEENRIFIKDSFLGGMDRAELFERGRKWTGVPVSPGYGKISMEKNSIEDAVKIRFLKGLDELIKR